MQNPNLNKVVAIRPHESLFVTDTTRPPDFSAVIAQLYIYPVKSCAGVALGEALLTETGLDLDRAWMVVDEAGEF